MACASIVKSTPEHVFRIGFIVFNYIENKNPEKKARWTESEILEPDISRASICLEGIMYR
jgi:hypothetical protein